MATPIYLKISDDIRNQIIHGLVDANALLPSENALAKQYQVSRMTVRKALNILVNEKFLYTVPGKGYFAKKLATNKFLFTFDELEIIKGQNKESQLMEVDIVKPDAQLIYQLRISPDKRVVVIKHLLYADGKRVAFDIKYIPYFTGIPIVEKEINYMTFPEIIANRTSIFDIHREISIRIEPSTPAIEEVLKLSAPEPVFMIEQKILDPDGLPIGWGQLYCHYQNCLIEGDSILGE
jgi:GntR family transcriptional regulator